MNKTRIKAYLALLTTSILWGLATPIIKKSFETTTPLLFLSYRFIFVTLLTTIPFILYQKKQKPIKNPLKLLLIGFLSFPLNLLILFYGLRLTSAVEAALLAALNPIFFNLTGWLFLKEKITRKEQLGLLTALMGTLVVTIDPLFINNHLNQENHLLGNILVVIGGIVGVAGLTWAKEEKKNYSHFQISYFSFLSALLSFTLLAILFEPSFTGNFLGIFSVPAIWGILYMAIPGSIVAYSCLIYGYSLIEVSEASLFTYLQPLFAAPLAVLWLKETVSLSFIIGVFLILLGVVLTEHKKSA